MFKEAKKQGEALLADGDTNTSAPPPFDPENPPTRWEKAVVGLNGIVAQVSKIDPDGVDVVCFSSGEKSAEWHRNIKDMNGLEALVTATEPSGECYMGQIMESVLNEAFERGFEARPCSILVLTAGRPDDHEALDKVIADAATKVKKASDLSITFVQVGDDEWAETYLKHLDDELTTTNAEGETIDIVDTIKDEDVKKAVGEYKKEGKLGNGKAGALFGAFAGAALGVGGVYLHNKITAKNRTKGWNGKWKAIYEGDEIAVLEVTDDMEGTLTISGWPQEGTSTGQYTDNGEGGFIIQHTQPDINDPVVGTIEDEHNIAWSDGTRWEEVNPDGAHWTHYAGAAVAGAAVTGTAGYLMQKKFFNKASNNVPSDYVIVLDRSKMMAIPDMGR